MFARSVRGNQCWIFYDSRLEIGRARRSLDVRSFSSMPTWKYLRWNWTKRVQPTPIKITRAMITHAHWTKQTSTSPSLDVKELSLRLPSSSHSRLFATAIDDREADYLRWSFSLNLKALVRFQIYFSFYSDAGRRENKLNLREKPSSRNATRPTKIVN